MDQFRTIYGAELLRRLRSRAFVVGLLFGGLGVALVTWLPSLLASVQFAQMRSIAVAGPAALVSPARALLERSGDFTVRVVATPKSRPDANALSRLGVSSLLELSQRDRRLQVTIYTRDPSNVQLAAIRGPLLPLDLALSTHRPPEQLRRQLAFPIDVRSVTARFSSAAAATTAHAIAFLLLFLLYMLIVFNSQLVLTSVAEEKTSRIAELLVASVDLSTLLIAKIFASTTLAALQMGSWIFLGFVLPHAIPGASNPIGASVAPISLSALPLSTTLGFLVFFVLGFLQMAVFFAGAGSLVNRTEDLGAISGPLFLPVIAAFIIAIMALSNPDATFAVVCSFVPVLSPFVMFARLAVSSVPLVQLALAASIDIACVVLFSIAGGRLYRVGMLLYGRAPSWPQVAKTMFGR
jgi:ABC-2 type transport system permease protein